MLQWSDLNPIIIGDLIERLKDKYNREESALEIVEKSGLWKMDVRQEYASIINKLATGSSEFTKAEQETLAIIAYKQPIKQSVIIKIRGNKAYDHIKKMVDIGLVKGKKVGRTKELNLSEGFYDYFSIGKKKGDIKEFFESEIGKGEIVIDKEDDGEPSEEVPKSRSDDEVINM